MGEGRGHAARARSMVEQLRGSHRIVLYSSFDALEFLRNAYRNEPQVEVREIGGLRFFYSGGRLELTKTIRHGLWLWWNRRELVQPIVSDIQRERPALVVTDFEPWAPRAAHQLGVPVLSLDHQHFMVAYDLAGLPLRLRRWAWLMSWSVWMFGIKQSRTVISAFYKPPLLPAWKHAIQVGPLLRPAVQARKPTNEGHLLSYLRKSTPPEVVDMLADCGQSVRVYGLGERKPQGGIAFRPISESGFLDDLATCDAVVAAAGNQLLGEALYFGKPIFALPEYKHHEQCINAHYLKALGGGDWAYLERVRPAQLNSFLDQRESYRRQLADSEMQFDGTRQAAEAIDRAVEELTP